MSDALTDWRRPAVAAVRIGRHVLAVGGLLLALLAAPAAAAVFSPQSMTLDNGLQVVVVTDRRVPVVSHMVWYKAGAADEPAGQSGVAHLLEHLMFKGTLSLPQGEFSRIVSRNGGQENAFTSYDYTAYFQNIARDRLELVMAMEADRMVNLVLDDAQVGPEKLVVLEERRQRVENDPAAILGEEAQATRYLNHPYRRPIIGWAEEIAGLTTADVLAFYRRWYTPANAVVVISGDVSLDEVRPLAERTYGRLAGAGLTPRQELAEPPQRAERRLVLQDPRAGQPSWTRSFRAPSYRSGAVEHAYPLQVLEEILGGGQTSRLYRALVVERRLAVSAAAWYDPSRRGPSNVVISASPRPEVDVATLESAVDDVLRLLLEAGVTEAEVQQAKQRMAADAVYARDSHTTAGHVIGEALAIGQSIDDVEAWPERIAAVTRAQVDAAARAVLSVPTVTAVLLGEHRGTAAALPPPSAGTVIR